METQAAVSAYETTRRPPTAAIMLLSRLNGWLETQGGPGGTVRDLLFTVLGKLRIPGLIFVNTAVPRV
jgi:hypothetical protein